MSIWNETNDRSTNKGVMQEYYEQNVFGDKVSNPAFQLSFVGTLISVFANLMSPLATILLSYLGTKVVLVLGTLLIAIGLFMAGFATEVSPCGARLYIRMFISKIPTFRSFTFI